jgi:hypothetical protein
LCQGKGVKAQFGSYVAPPVLKMYVAGVAFGPHFLLPPLRLGASSSSRGWLGIRPRPPLFLDACVATCYSSYWPRPCAQATEGVRAGTPCVQSSGVGDVRAVRDPRGWARDVDVGVRPYVLSLALLP